MAKYRKKPIVIEAMQYLREDNISSIHDFVGIYLKYDPIVNEYSIRTLEGDMLISRNDYVIKGIKGEFYPCKPDIFEASYELAE